MKLSGWGWQRLASTKVWHAFSDSRDAANFRVSLCGLAFRESCSGWRARRDYGRDTCSSCHYSMEMLVKARLE